MIQSHAGSLINFFFSFSLTGTGIVSLPSIHDRVGCCTSFLSHLQWLGMAADKQCSCEHSKGAKARTV